MGVASKLLSCARAGLRPVFSLVKSTLSRGRSNARVRACSVCNNNACQCVGQSIKLSERRAAVY
eukprot:6083911-Lingulodinium_polyedra.AAC.1